MTSIDNVHGSRFDEGPMDGSDHLTLLPVGYPCGVAQPDSTEPVGVVRLGDAYVHLPTHLYQLWASHFGPAPRAGRKDRFGRDLDLRALVADDLLVPSAGNIEQDQWLLET